MKKIISSTNNVFFNLPNRYSFGKWKQRSLYLFILIFFSINNLFSQIQTSNYETELEENSISFGSDKILNTFLFKLYGRMLLPTNFGNFALSQNYRGSALRTLQTAFRDDETFNFEYSLPFGSNIFLIATSNWIYSNDSRTIGINEMQRLNGLLGMRYFTSNRTLIELSSGIEKNSQLGVQSLGPIINLKSRLPKTNLLDLDLAGKLLGEYVHLEDGRINADLDFDANIQKKYSIDDYINTNLSYKLLNRDFLSHRASSTLEENSKERRFENRIVALGNIGFAFSPSIKSQIDLSFSKLSVLRAYLQSVEDIPFSKVNRMLDELQVSSTGQILLNFNKFKSIIGLSYNQRNEENTVSKKFDITEEEEQMLRQLENQRDNISSRTRFFNKSSFQASDKDTLYLEYSVSLMQYNTPSQQNNDDRDEFYTIANCIWSHRFSKFFNATLIGELQMTHLVFLKAQRSSLNNWNRVYRLSSSFQYDIGNFKFNPQFELLANYTVYDFEDISPSIKSFSFRQISYKDSIMIMLDVNLRFQSKLTLRYFERGVLNWQEFKESPQNSNYEHFINGLLIWSKPNAFEFAFGIRWFNLTIRNLTSNPLQNNLNMNQYSIGPETYFNINFSDKTNISLVGWFEFQYINKVYNRGIPNFFLLTKVKL